MRNFVLHTENMGDIMFSGGLSPKQRLTINDLYKLRGKKMTVSYNGLWKILIDKNMKKMDLVTVVGISSSTLAKMGKGEPVSMEVLAKICDKLECDIGDIVSYTK